MDSIKFSKSQKLKDTPKTGVRVPSAPALLFSGSHSSFCDLLKLKRVLDGVRRQQVGVDLVPKFVYSYRCRFETISLLDIDKIPFLSMLYIYEMNSVF